MNLEKDLKKVAKEKQFKESAIASIKTQKLKILMPRPRADKHILSTNPEMQKI